jgi:prophage antirepressor-like protein
MTSSVSQLTTIAKAESNFKVQYVVVNGEPWFKAKEVASILGYVNTKQAILQHVRDKRKLKLNELRGLNLDHQTLPKQMDNKK